MSQRDKENKQIQDKLKQFFKKKQMGISKRVEFVLTDDVLKDLSKESPLSVRSQTLIDLNDNILNHKLDENTVGILWYHFRDIFAVENPKETRDICFQFLRTLVLGQYDRLINLMRAEIFHFIKLHNVPEDLPQRFEVLQVLTNNGKDLQYFEEELAPFMLGWMNQVPNYGKEAEFLGMLLNIIKFNAAYLDDDIIVGIVREINFIIFAWRNTETVLMTLQILDALIAYSNLPSTCLPEFIAALCRTVHVRETYITSWNVMKNLLGTHMGHKSIYIMCRILEDESLKKEALLLRGAVLFLHISLWSTYKINKLLCPPHSILPAYLMVLNTKHPGIVYEVTMGIQSLVKTFHASLVQPVWETIMNILTSIAHQIEESPDNEIIKLVAGPFHQILDFVEHLVDTDNYYGDANEFYQVLELVFHRRTDASVYKLIDHLTSNVAPYHDQWLVVLHNVLQKYFKPEIRANIRLKVLENLDKIMHLYRTDFEDELVDGIIIPDMSNIHCDTEVMFRANASKLLIDMCLMCDWKKCVELLEILEKLLLQPFDDHTYDYKRVEESDFYDLVCLVTGLIQLFTKKMYRLPSSHAVKAYKMLVEFLEMNYKHPKVLEVCNEPKYMVIECFLKMRADNRYRLGYPENGKWVYSPYLCITYKNSETGGPLATPPPTSPAITQLPPSTTTYITLNRIFNVFITCLKEEKDWKILSMVLEELPSVLQNKNLILSKEGNKEVYLLAETCSAMIHDKRLNLPDSLNESVYKPDFHSAVLLVLLNMASYHKYMPPVYQKNLIASLMQCIKILNKNLRSCVLALMIVAVEMREAMMKMLPQVLLSVSHTSATKANALPILEFLSVLSQLPRVYSNFTGDQYMAIFAIALPYTNPFKYNTFIASLAHYVITTWFMKCRLELRKKFVKYIIIGLQTNVLIPFEEEKASLRNELLVLNELNKDSAERKRSSSLTEQRRPRKRAATVSVRAENNPKRYFQKPALDSAVLTFYEELTETCVDLMARFAFLPPGTMIRSASRCDAITEYLTKNGQSMTWLVGRSIVTIKTSGCAASSLKDGICEKCWEAINNLDNKDSSNVSRQNSNEKSDNGTFISSPAEENKKVPLATGDHFLDQLPNKLKEFMESDERNTCPCWCLNWVEIHYRRPTGDMRCLVRMDHRLLNFDIPLNELSNIILPFISSDNEMEEVLTQTDEGDEAELEGAAAAAGLSSEGSNEAEILVPGSPVVKQAPSRQSSKESIEEEQEAPLYDDGGASAARNPVRRSNSSPEMSPSWKNPFLKRQESEDGQQCQDDEGLKKSKLHSKDMKVSCEAIPEEIAGSGTTPPKSAADPPPATTTAPPATSPSPSGPSPSPSSSAAAGPSSVASSSSSTAAAPSAASQPPQQPHPSLLTCHSYPGSSPPKSTGAKPKASSGTSQTVPPSPSTNRSQPSFPSRTFAFLKGKSESIESAGSDKGAPITSGAPAANKGNLTLSCLPPLAAKPPQSPTQTSPRLPRHMLIRDGEGHEIQKSSSSSIIEKGLNLARDRALQRKNVGGFERTMAIQDVNQSQKRDRLHTVSVMGGAGSSKQPDQGPKAPGQQQGQGQGSKEKPRSGLNPSLLFIHMYHSSIYGFKGEHAMLVSDGGPAVQRTLKILDSIPPYHTYTIGVIYVGEGQCNNEVEILRNTFGSLRFYDFLRSIGSVIQLKDADPQVIFLGGLEQNGNDGEYAYIWESDFVRIMFHVATMMPTREKERDPKCTNKKKHIGNDSVVIVYNESGEEYHIDTLTGQMNFASIIIEPLDHSSNRITVKFKTELEELIGHVEPMSVSDQNVGTLTRQLAIHYDLASLVLKSFKTNAQDPYSSNWMERLRKIKQVGEKLLEEKEVEKQNKYREDPVYTARLNKIQDLTEYT